MCDTNTDVDTNPDANAEGDSHAGTHTDPEEAPSVLVARVQDSEDGPAECTLYPREAAGLDLMTTWITAREGGYVALEEMR